jgi:hypothetical protein
VTVEETGLRPGFDPSLPLLPKIFNLTFAAERFEHHLGDVGRPQSVRARSLQDVKYEPGIRCVATYELSVRVGDAVPAHALGVLEVASDGVRTALPHGDPVLDGLAQALDPERMAPRFTTSPEIGEELTGPPRIRALRYKPRLRCALRYDLPTKEGDRVLFGKMLADGSERAMATLSELDRLSREHSALPRVAAPLVHWPDLRLLLQEAVEGHEFHSLVFDDRVEQRSRERLMRSAGEKLAGLHCATEPPGPVRTLDDDLEELSEYGPVVAAFDRELARDYQGCVQRIASVLHGEPALVPSHGAFRTDQFMIRGDELVLIDLDGYCWADPARDIGNLLAYLRWKSLRQPHLGPFIDRATESFSNGYSSVRPLPDEGRLVGLQAASLLKISGRRFRSLSWKEWPLVPLLMEESRRLLRS